MGKNSCALKRVRASQIELEFKVLVFTERGKPQYPQKNLSEQRREPKANLTHIWCGCKDLNSGHVGGRWVLSPMRHPYPPPPKIVLIWTGHGQANWELERIPAALGILKPLCSSLPCLFPSARTKFSQRGCNCNRKFNVSPKLRYHENVSTTRANIEELTFLPHVPIVSPYKFFAFHIHFPGTGQVSRKRNLCGSRRAETGLIQHRAGHRTSLQGELQNITTDIYCL